MSISRRPKKARTSGNCTAWWYDERGGIGIYISDREKTVTCRIKRSDLIKYIERTKRK